MAHASDINELHAVLGAFGEAADEVTQGVTETMEYAMFVLGGLEDDQL